MSDGETEKAEDPRSIEANAVLALRILSEAQRIAEEVGAPTWQYAVDLRDLEEQGVTRTAIRWLIAKRRVETAIETTLPGSFERTFQTYRGTSLGSSTCLVLHTAGSAPAPAPATGPVVRAAPPRTGLERVLAANQVPSPPVWNPESRELTVDGLTVKRFRVPAPNQELILQVFMEEGWPTRIDDPLPIVQGVERKRRLQATIVCLNRCQQQRLLRFRGDGLGSGIQWERTDTG